LQVLEASDPFTAMALECFVPDAEASVVKTQAYWRFETWCGENGHNELLFKVRSNKFGDRLKAVAGFEGVWDGRPHGEPRRWYGMRLRPRTG
jgi:Poxvirus D5 protein-like